jgi:hypothetical protein
VVSQVTLRRSGGAAGAAARRPGQRAPTRSSGSPSRTGAAEIRLGARAIPRDSIFQGPTGPAASFARWTPTATLVLVERRHDLGLGIDSVVGRSSGVLFGAELESAPHRRVRVRISGLRGTVSANSTTGEAGRIGELQLDVGVGAAPWFWFHAGAGRRALRTEVPVGIKHWTSLRTGAEVRFGLGRGAAQGVLQVGVLPYISASGQTDRPPVGLTAGAGIDYRTNRVTAGLYYGLERFDFPATAAGRQREQFSSLRLRIGMEFGR